MRESQLKRHWSTWWIAFGAPLAIAAAAMTLMATWRDQLPDPVATHWDGSGEPDGFQALDTLIWSFGAVVVGITLFSAIIMAAVKVPARGLTSFSVGLATFMAVLLTGSVHVQRGIDDAGGQELPGVWFAIALATGLVAAGLAALITRPDLHDVEPPAARPIEPTIASGTTPAAHHGTVVSGPLTIVSLVLVGSMLLLSFISWEVGVIAALLCVPVVLLNSWGVTADSGGFTVRTRVPMIRLHADIEAITGVDVVEVNPMADFGGWGIRMGSLASPAVVLRSGSAVRVHRRDKRPLLVVIDDADVFARVLDAHRPTPWD